MIPCPVPLETLVELFAGELDDGARDAIEEHVFSCEGCGKAYAALGALAGALTEVVPPVISHAHRDRLLAQGQRLVVTPVTPGVTPTARFAPDVDLLVHVLRADLSRAERVDVAVTPVDGSAPMVFEAVPFDRDRGEVLIACQRHYETLPTMKFRLHAHEGGEARLVGDYYVEHVWR